MPRPVSKTIPEIKKALNDDVLCWLAENQILRGVTPVPQEDGGVRWRARLLHGAAIIQAGWHDTALEAIRAVRYKANDQWRLDLSDDEIFWLNGKIRLPGITYSDNDPEKPWVVHVSYDWQRFFVGSFPDLLSALKARKEASQEEVLLQYRQEHAQQLGRWMRENKEWRQDLEMPPLTDKLRRRVQKRSGRNRSGMVGVCRYSPRGCWQAYITVRGKTHHLGFFDTVDEAREARRRAEELVASEQS